MRVHLLAALLSTCLVAQADELITRDGKVYPDFTVIAHDSGFITILYSDGGAKIPLSQLDPAMQEKYGYDPAKAARALAAEQAQEAADARRIEQEREIVQARKMQEQAADQAEQRAQQAAQQKEAWRIVLQNSGKLIDGTVLEVTTQGCLVDVPDHPAIAPVFAGNENAGGYRAAVVSSGYEPPKNLLPEGTYFLFTSKALTPGNRVHVVAYPTGRCSVQGYSDYLSFNDDLQAAFIATK